MQTRDIVSDPATEMPTNLKLKSTDLREALKVSSDIARRVHRFAYQRQAPGSPKPPYGGAEEVFSVSISFFCVRLCYLVFLVYGDP